MGNRAASLLLLLISSAVWCALVSAASAAPSITEYSTGLPASSAPLGIAVGPDEDLWATQSAGVSGFAQITTAGAISSFTKLFGPFPREITTGPEGALWFTETEGNANIGVLYPASALLAEYKIPAGSTPIGITTGPEGDMWFAESGGNAMIGRIVPSTHVVTEVAVPLKNSKPSGIALGPEGDLWFTQSNNPGGIGKLDPKTDEITEYTEGLTANSGPWGITRGPEGDMWFTEAVNPGRIGRIDPKTGAITEFSTGLTVGTPENIVAGSDGNLYFTESNAGGALGKITPAGVITEYVGASGLTEKSKPWGITSGPDGNIWFVENANPARIGRLTVAPHIDWQGAMSGAHQAMLIATVGANAQATSYSFEYGPTSSYGSATPLESAGSRSSPAAVSSGIVGLEAATVYHYRVVATNASGTTHGPDATFTTAAGTGGLPKGVDEPPPSGPGTLGGVAPPVIGRTATVAPASGRTLVKRPSSGVFVPLEGGASVPVGSVIEALHGAVTLTTALDNRGHSQTATVWGGVFEVTQSPRGGGMTQLTLRGPKLSCRRRGLAHSSASKPKKRSLWARDSHGRYTTHGANSAATVMGTEWETTDTCAGTITRVARGRVRVRDLHTHRTVVVRAGHSFLARP